MELQQRSASSEDRRGLPRTATPQLDARIDTVRRFNRFYTQRIGVLREGLYDSAYSLAEVRALYELAHAAAPITATDLAQTLTIDAAFHATCIAPAWLTREERSRGTLLPGRAADLVVLDRDPWEDLDAQVVATMVAGRWVHNPPPW